MHSCKITGCTKILTVGGAGKAGWDIKGKEEFSVPLPFLPGKSIVMFSLQDAKMGDIIRFERAGYKHYGVVTKRLPKNIVEIVHVTKVKGASSKMKKACVKKEYFELAPKRMSVDNRLDDYCEPYSAKTIARRANEAAEVGEEGSWTYCVLTNNCEHFAYWCRYGESDISEQSTYLDVVDDVLIAKFLPTVSNGSFEVTALKAKFGLSDADFKGLVSEVNLVEAKAGPMSATIGLSATTGVTAGNDTIGASVLGTGFKIGKRTEVSLFGMKLGFDF